MRWGQSLQRPAEGSDASAQKLALEARKTFAQAVQGGEALLPRDPAGGTAGGAGGAGAGTRLVCREDGRHQESVRALGSLRRAGHQLPPREGLRWALLAAAFGL